MKILNPIILSFILLLLMACKQKQQDENFNPATAKRIVSVSKQITEMLFALGKGKDIVACDLTSSYPDSAKLLPKVGYHRLLSTEGIVSMRPDVVVYSPNIGPATVIPQLQQVGIRCKEFFESNTLDSAQLLLTALANYFGVKGVADSLNKQLQQQMQTVYAAQKQCTDTPKVMVIQFGQANNVFFVMSGRNGPADAMIRLAVGKPAVYQAKGASQLSAEAIATANPDVVIVTDFGFDKLGGVEGVKKLPGVALTNAAKNNRIYRFNEHDIVYFGPRSAENILLLMKLLHPNIHATLP
ncbi:heme/hemin ABC transporter substrate-binding protein [Hydrotalea sandarakina]|jgi:iron complex transport system substrate-binding protein|uniref:Iron complex transport system substrate-binding protein n=1 Tax=Hydrotalea sandarakina TaxID=1004304 RepID=A0A2W7RVI7_9BACT|nr:ABC transporter substrate-binding protein [Hydrotalea sandarakina]PZX62856.1 iron complex transport system substrate-binding protein [Hydrotalea sandarakina]